MPIHKASGGFQWGNHGHVYPTKAGAEKQAEAAHANGYRGDAAKAQCAGILFIRGDKVLLLHRADRDEWEGPGGHIEDGESPVQAAVRECAEETGLAIQVEPREIGKSGNDKVDYTNFALDVDGDLSLTLNHEHDKAAWFPIAKLPDAVNPGVRKVLRQDASDPHPKQYQNTDWESRNRETYLENDAPNTNETGKIGHAESEWEVIDKLRKGELQSPVRFGPLWLFAMRVTGTGIAYRPQHEEWVYRPPRYYLTEEFLERIKGLPILLQHAEEGPVQGEEFHERAIGVIVAPWIDKDEESVWGIGKIYDDTDAALIVDRFPSTSPSVDFEPGAGEMKELANGEHIFIEPAPRYIDHLAVVPEGVWDKYNGPTGINLSTLGERNDGRNATGAMAPYSWRR